MKIGKSNSPRLSLGKNLIYIFLSIEAVDKSELHELCNVVFYYNIASMCKSIEKLLFLNIFL